ncbi:S8 family serine peptidase, partial [Micromonospora sp. MP36]|uniref:Kelch repeat-containing protein n=2 Tax=unclassified Micromonospora TaxID=2617518 RepID=UPI002105AA15
MSFPVSRRGRTRPRRLVDRLICGLASITLIASAVALSSPAAQAAANPQPNGHDKIRPALLDKLKTKGKADFWVRFDAAADLSEASRIVDWNKRGAAVAKALRETARASQADVRTELDRAHVQYKAFWATNAIHVSDGSLKMAEQLAAEPEVQSLWPPQTYQMPEPMEGTAPAEVNSVEWGIANINADDVWAQYGVTGAGITVANIDTGVQYDHPALVRQYRGNKGDGTFDHNYNWFDATGRCPGVPCDGNGHGTHTMGTMAGDDGGSNHIGVAPGVRWIAANGCCPSDTALIESGQWMLEPTDLHGQNPDASKRPNVINNSWGSGSPSNDPFMEDISAAWTASGIFAAWSNGNNGGGCNTSGSPGSRIINYSVGAYDSTNAIGWFSSRGAGQNGEIKPNIAAPGVNVRSSVPGGGYGTKSGTSMAAPHLAGAVALLWSAAPALAGDVATTKVLLDGSAIDTPNNQCGGTDADNNVFGEGRLDVLALVKNVPAGVTGTVTDAASGKPIQGVTVSVGELNTNTDAEGRYRLVVPAGEHQVTFNAFGYAGATVAATVPERAFATLDKALTALPRVHVTGKVTDGSGHGWPLYTRITVPGDPSGAHFTDPYTGKYDLLVPADRTYQLTFDPDLQGYPTLTREVAAGGADTAFDLAVPVDAAACTAPGYAVRFDGLTQSFDAPTIPDGWTVTDAVGNGEVWRFDNPGTYGNRTRGTGLFAAVYGKLFDPAHTQDTTLTTPVADLSGAETPIVEFNTYHIGYFKPTAHVMVDLSIDNGQSWQTVWEKNASSVSGSVQTIQVPQAAGRSQVMLRFHYIGAGGNIWQIDNVKLGQRLCAPQPGGLVIGQVTDANTGAGLNSVPVSMGGAPAASSGPTPDDAALGDGFYTLLAPPGEQTLSAGRARYTTLTKTVTVVGDAVTKVDLPLPAGRLEVTGSINETVAMGGRSAATVTVMNTGTAPANVTLNERTGGRTILTTPSATPRMSSAVTSRHALAGTKLAESSAPDASEAVAGNGGWVYGPGLPTSVADNVVAVHDGKVYSVGGVAWDYVPPIYYTNKGWVLDPRDGGWKPIANQPTMREKANGTFVGDKLYITGGWSAKGDGSIAPGLDIYDPRTNTWSTGSPAPVSYAASGVATLDGRMYVVGGCTRTCGTADVWVYTPSTDSWQRAANYPELTSWLACGVIGGKMYCAGGTTDKDASNKTFVYDPATNTWTRAADMPHPVYAAAYSAANGMLIVSGGAGAGAAGVYMDSWAYDAAGDTWYQLANFPIQPTYRGGGACGFYHVGGGDGGPGWFTQILPGFDVCDEGDASWLSLDARRLTVPPGQSATVTVTLDAATMSVTQPGDLFADITVDSDTPYRTAPVAVAMHVTPPKSWGKVTGTVSGLDCEGVSAPLGGASVQLEAAGLSVRLPTDKDGRYAYWLDKKYDPLTLIAADKDYVSASRQVRIKAGATTTVNFTLKSSFCM